jgi:hypothetical protein
MSHQRESMNQIVFAIYHSKSGKFCSAFSNRATAEYWGRNHLQKDGWEYDIVEKVLSDIK